MPKAAPILFNPRVLAVLLAGWVFGAGSVIFWVLLADYVAWLFSWPDREVDPGVFRKSDVPGQIYEFVPGRRFRFYFGGRRIRKRWTSAVATINADGFRGPAAGRSPAGDGFRILVLGDSFTFGAGVHDGEEFIRRVEARWAGEGRFPRRVEFVNASVGGYNTVQEVAALRKHLPAWRPDMVWLFISLEDTFPWGKVVVREDGTLFRPGAPFRMRARRRATRLSGLFWWTDYARRYRMADGYIPPFFDPGFSGYRRWKEALDVYAALIEDPSRSLVFIAPGIWRLDEYPWKAVHERIRSDVESRGLACVDLLPAIEGREMLDLWCHPLDQHPNAEAHALLAGYIESHPGITARVRERMEAADPARVNP